MTYRQARSYCESLINYERLGTWPYQESLKLQRFRDFLFSIGNPQEELRCIHVAGSKGKGSTCACIAYILREAGYRVGLYTSPHLCDPRERIRVLHPRSRDRDNPFEGMIARSSFAALIARLKPAIDQFNAGLQGEALSFFEVYTALAFVYLRQQRCDFVVLETGLGGRLDATNTVNALVSVITPISLEHTRLLGTTVAQIAAEKAAIIKPRSSAWVVSLAPVAVSAPQDDQALQVIRARCAETKSRLSVVGEDVQFCARGEAGFSVRLRTRTLARLKVSLAGAHQAANAATALAAVDALRVYGVQVSVEAMRAGLSAMIWPGRGERIGRAPAYLLDGAQNEASARALAALTQEVFPKRRVVLVFGASEDKDIAGMLGVLSPCAQAVILTRSRNPRAAPVEMLEEKVPAACRAWVEKSRGVAQALTRARLRAAKNDVIVVTGSLFVVGEARALLRRAYAL